MNRLKDKIAIITGAASGQGAAEAKLFALEGARVVITDLNDHDGRAIASQIGACALFVHHDVGDEKSWKGVLKATPGCTNRRVFRRPMSSCWIFTIGSTSAAYSSACTLSTRR
jgi:NAD(P)-dependent dehydrogenase (short-subunit alcohol dehydrogenase family)